MDKHYQLFKQNLSWIEMDFKKLLETQSFISTNLSDKKTVDAKKVAIMMEKYLDQSPNMLYQIITRNLGKINITWDDLLKCLQDEFNLSYTVLKRQSKSFSISEARWNPNSQYKRIHQYLKLKQANCIQYIIKPQLGFNISQVSSQSDFLAVLLEKELLFYLIQEDRIVSVMEFKYRNVKQKLLKKYHQIEDQKNQARKNHQSIDFMPLQDHNKIKQTSKGNKGKKQQNKYQVNIKESNRLVQSEEITPSVQSKNRSRLNSNASSDLSTFIKRYQTDNGASDWKKKSMSKRQNSVKIKTNTTRKVFELFQNAKLQNSIQIAKRFQQSRDSFQQFVMLDKKLLQKQIKKELEEETVERHTFDFKGELEKMKLTAKLMPKYKKSCAFFGVNGGDKHNNNYELYFKSLEKNKAKQNILPKSKGVDKSRSQSMNKSLRHTSHEPSNLMDPISNDMNEANKLLEDNKIGVVSYSFHENFLLVSLYNRQVRLYRIKKNLHKIKQKLVFQKHNDSVVTYVHLYKATFAQTYNMILCSNKNNQTPMIKIYEISNEKISSSVFQQDQQTGLQNYEGMERSLASSNYLGKDFREIFNCKLSFDPIYQNLSPLGIGAFNERGFLALIEINNISVDCQNKSEKKIFEKDFFNTNTGEMISFVSCRVHSNMINLYLVCKSGFIYFVDKLTAKIKLLRKLSQYKIFDLQMLKESTQILVVSQKGELMIVNSQNLEPMYFLQMYMSLSEDSRLLKLAENKFIFYGPRALRVVEITENEQKLLQYQKPLKIYRNRIKIKKQQALLSKQTNEIQGRKQKLQNSPQMHQGSLLDHELTHSKSRGHSIQGAIRESKMEKFQSKLNKRKIEQFYEVSTVQNGHYVMVLQNGQILVYNSKGQYYGSYLKNRGLQPVLCVLNKKLHYLAILYSNNTVDIVNLYSQVSILKLPLLKSDQQQLLMLKSTKTKGFLRSNSIGQHNQNEEIIMVGFVDIVSGGNNSHSNKPQPGMLSYELIYVLDRSFVLKLLTFKGVVTKSVYLNNFQININLTQAKTIASCTYWDRTGELIIGNDKGQVLFYQKNTLQYHKMIKISTFAIVKIQSLTNNKRDKEKQNYLLCLVENNELFLIHKYTGIFKKVYSPQIDISKQKLVRFEKQPNAKPNQQTKLPNTRNINKQRQSSMQSQQKHRHTLVNILQTHMIKDEINNQHIDREGKVSSTHYFSKMVGFSQFYAVYEWQEIYEKQIRVHDNIEGGFQFNNKSQTLSLKKAMESIVKIDNTKGEQKLPSKSELRQYKTKGYLIEKLSKTIITDGDFNKSKTMTKSEQVQDHFNTDKQFTDIFTNPNCYFLKVYSTEDQFLISHNSASTQKLNKPYQIYCFTDTTKLTVIIEPQSQFRNINFNNSKLTSKNITNKQSLMNSSFNSRKNSLDGINVNNLSMSINKMIKKTIMRVYDLQHFIKSNKNCNIAKDEMPFKVVLQQQI